MAAPEPEEVRLVPTPQEAVLAELSPTAFQPVPPFWALVRAPTG